MVSDKVEVVTKKYGEEQAWRWISEGTGGYTIEEAERDGHGTDVIMHIREDGEDKDEYSKYMREYPIYKLVKKYSDYIRFPIKMLMPQPRIKEGSDPQNPEYEEVYEYEVFNSMVPLWQRKKSDVTQEEYDEFYKQTYQDDLPPLETITVSVEGIVSYDSLMFIPEKIPNKYYSDDFSATDISLDAGRMIFILPDEGVSVSQVLKSNSLFDLISDPWTFNKKSLRINLSVPKFDINSSLSMDKSLKALGVTDAFEISRADFSPIFTQTQSALTEFKHAARVKIDEEGCEAAAYSFITSTGSSAPPDDEIDFVLDRPFIFVITGADSLPRFIGTVNNL
jgi:hypothetical protein